MIAQVYSLIVRFTLLSAFLLVTPINIAIGQTNQANKSAAQGHSIQDRKVIRIAMGSTLKPMHFKNANDKLVGFEVDLAYLFARSLGRKLEIIDPYEINSSSLRLLLSGKVDIALNSLSITDQRKQWVDFSYPYFSSRTGLVVNAKAKNNFQNSNTTIINLLTSTRYNVTNHNRTAYYNFNSSNIYLDSLKKIYSTIENEKYPDFSGYVFAYDWMALKQLDPKVFKVLNIALGKHDYGAAFRKRNTFLKDKWNEFISSIKNNGKYQAIYDKWFSDTPLPSVVKLEKNKNTSRCTGFFGLDVYKTNPVNNRDFEWKYTNKEWHLKEHLLKKFKSSAIPFLPLMNCDAAPVIGSISRGYLLVNPLIKKYYRTEYGPYINELYGKIHRTPRKYEMKKLYEELTLTKGIVDMLPRYFPINNNSIHNRFFINAFYMLHEKHREDVYNLYKESNKNKKDNSLITFNLMNELSMPVMIFNVLEKGKNNATKIRLSNNYFYKNPNFKIKVIKQDSDGKPIIKINNVTGIFQSLKATGGNSIYSIYDINKGKIRSLYAIGDIFKIDNSNYGIHMKNNGYEFYYNSDKDLITRITKLKDNYDFINDMTDETNVLLTKIWLDGKRDFKHYKLDDGSVYMLDPDYKRKNSNNNYLSKVYYKQPTDSDFKLVGEIEGTSHPKYRYLIDNKLFLASIGYDDSYTPQVLNFKTGKTKVIERGVYGAAMVPISKNNILYCSPKSSFVINTLTLHKEKITIENIPCPGKTGAFINHPKDDHLIYHGWELL